MVQDLGPEDMAQYPSGQQEALSFRAYPARAVQSDAAAGNDAMQVRVMPEGLSPGVQHGKKPVTGRQPRFPEIEQRLGRCAKQNAVDDTRVLKRQGSELMRQRKDNVEVGDRQQLAHSFIEPLDTRGGLALRTMPIATRVVGHFAVAALVALIYMAAQGLGTTGRNVAKNSALRG